MLEFDLRTYLTGKSTVASYIGTGPARMYPCRRPRSAAGTALTYRRTTGTHGHQLTQASGWAQPRIELVAVSDSYDTAKKLAEVVRDEMQGFSGTMGTTAVKSVTLDDESDDFIPPDDGSDIGTYEITLGYRILYSESLPTFA